jgi:hypothetical protein
MAIIPVMAPIRVRSSTSAPARLSPGWPDSATRCPASTVLGVCSPRRPTAAAGAAFLVVVVVGFVVEVVEVVEVVDEVVVDEVVVVVGTGVPDGVMGN